MRIRILAVLCCLLLMENASFPFPVSSLSPAEGDRGWADSVLASLTLDQKIAQLMMLRIYSNKKTAYNDTMVAQQKRYQWGGYCFFQSYPVCQARLTNRLQAVSRVPSMIAIDGEWGLGMRLDSVRLYPRQMALGASRDTAGIYEMGKQMALQCHRIGVHVNFAPDVDINNNPNNPVINSRSFGSDPYWVARCGVAYMRGMQDHGVMATAKHYPGHGDTETDSHKATPLILHSRKRLQKLEFQPFRELIQAGTDGVMVGHLGIPALDSAYISTASHTIMTGLLKNEMGFSGLVCTDALDMKGISNLYAPGELEVQVLLAGADLLLLPPDPVVALKKIKEAVLNGILSEELIDERCLKILKMKEKYVLPYAGPVQTEHLLNDINNPDAEKVYQRLTESSVTLLRNKHHVIPVPEGDGPLMHLRVDNAYRGQLDRFFQDRWNTRTLRILPRQAEDTQFVASLCRKADSARLLYVTLNCLSQYPENRQYGLTPAIASMIDRLSEHTQLVLIVMGNPYCLNFLSCAKKLPAILIAYHPTEEAEKAVVKVLDNRLPVHGKLPVELNDFPCGSGTDLLMSVLPRTQRSGDYDFGCIDSIAKEGLDAKAYPGCRVLLGQHGKILYDKSFGTYSYEDLRPVSPETLYDLASVTKCMATTLAVMYLYDRGQIRMEAPLSHYLPYLKESNKKDITVAEAMTHTAGLVEWIPFYKLWGKDIYSNYASDSFSVPVCRDMYMNVAYRDSIRNRIRISALRKDKHYKYSDLGFYLMADVVKEISGMPLDTFLYRNIYCPLGLTHTCFNPYLTQSLDLIAPTENDKVFRCQQIRGYVHDQGAAMSGGVSGHAGLFSTAEEVGVLAQMLLNGGSFQGVELFRPETVRRFTQYYYPDACRRGLGFDKPSRSGVSPCGRSASSESFGHSGFTGTFFWVDPEYDLFYVFLSNRVCPDAGNSKLSSMNIRTRIQDAFYHLLQENLQKKAAEE